MFPRTAAGIANTPARPGAAAARPSGAGAAACAGCGEVFGELPVACLAEEIETPGAGQIRALMTIAGNPVVSTPNGERLAAALERLDFMVSVDIYINETTRHADVILPAPSPLERSHYDLVLTGFAVRNVANYSPPVLAPDPDVPDEWETLLRLTGVVTGQGPDADVAAIDDFVALEAARRADARRALAASTGATPRRCWPRWRRASGPSGCSTCCCAAGPVPADARRPRGRAPRHRPRPARAAPARGAAHAEREGRARARAARRRRRAPARGAGRAGQRRMVLIGRRDLRSNNSWMHNLPKLVSGPARCTAHVHPDDAARLGLVDGEPARVRSRDGAIEVPRRGDRRHHARRRLDPARLGPRPPRRASSRVAARARRGELQRARRRGARSSRCPAPPSSTASRSRSRPLLQRDGVRARLAT